MGNRINPLDFDPNPVKPPREVEYADLVEFGRFIQNHAVGELWLYYGNYYTVRVNDGVEYVYRIHEELANKLPVAFACP